MSPDQPETFSRCVTMAADVSRRPWPHVLTSPASCALQFDPAAARPGSGGGAPLVRRHDDCSTQPSVRTDVPTKHHPHPVVPCQPLQTEQRTVAGQARNRHERLLPLRGTLALEFASCRPDAVSRDAEPFHLTCKGHAVGESFVEHHLVKRHRRAAPLTRRVLPSSGCRIERAGCDWHRRGCDPASKKLTSRCHDFSPRISQTLHLSPGFNLYQLRT